MELTSALSGFEIITGSSYRGSICPTGAKIGSSYRSFEKSRVREIGGEIIELMKQIQGKQGLVRDFGRFGKPRVQEMGIPV